MTMNSVTGASGHCFAQRSVTAADACCCLAPDRTRPVVLAPLWNLSRLDRTLHFVRSVVQSVVSGHAENITVTKNSVICASGHSFAQRPVTAADA